MIVYKTNDLIKKALSLVDLKNNSFITNEMAVQLLNDSYIQCYQKLIDIKHEDFLKSVDINSNDELPSDLYQIAEVYYIYKNNPFKKYSLVKNRDYLLKNGKIMFKDHYNDCVFCLDYYPIPDKLTLNDDGFDKHDFKVPLVDVSFTDSQFAQVGKYLFVINGSKIYRIEYGKASYKEYTLDSNVIDIFAVNDAMAVNTSRKYYVFSKNGSMTEYATTYGVNTYNIVTKEFSYTDGVTRRVKEFDANHDYDTAYESIKWNNGVFVCTYEDTMVVDEITRTFDNPVIISKVGDDKNLIYAEAIASDNRLNKFTFTQVFTPEKGTSILTVPNNAFYSLLSYDLAVAIKTISGEDISALSVLRDNAYMTFADTMKKDIQPYVIEDVYDTGRNWWF